MSKLTIPKEYKPVLTPYETQTAIGLLKRTFAQNIRRALNLKRVSAPLFVEPNSGLNDNLNGIERPVEFDIAETKTNGQVVQSLAKWKRLALHKYDFGIGEGLYTDMNAIRRDEEMDNLHSIYVDQWDWEMIISEEDRHLDFLKNIVQLIVNAIYDTKEEMKREFPSLTSNITKEVAFVTTQQLEDMYPSLSPKERENEYTKIHQTVFIMQIGDVLKSGKKHDGRAPDYDDWSLNGDILIWNNVLESALEISSMGIRVDSKSLDVQLTKSNNNDRRKLDFHKMLLNNELPLTLGGGIGQSRISMLLLEKAHVGEVQVSIWDKETIKGCKEAGIILL